MTKKSIIIFTIAILFISNVNSLFSQSVSSRMISNFGINSNIAVENIPNTNFGIFFEPLYLFDHSSLGLTGKINFNSKNRYYIKSNEFIFSLGMNYQYYFNNNMIRYKTGNINPNKIYPYVGLAAFLNCSILNFKYTYLNKYTNIDTEFFSIEPIIGFMYKRLDFKVGYNFVTDKEKQIIIDYRLKNYLSVYLSYKIL